MRFLVSLSLAALLALAALPGAAAGQARKSKTKASASRTAAAAGTAGKSQTSSTTGQAAAATTAPAVSTLETQGDGVRRITPAAARAAVEQGKAVVVDVRGEDSYKAGHIKGARWINLNEIEARARELPRDKMIITYCS
jgi:hypothetical protein